jgi:hypothetical protein
MEARKLFLIVTRVVVFPSADIRTAAGKPFLRRYPSGRDECPPYGDKQIHEYSKWQARN